MLCTFELIYPTTAAAAAFFKNDYVRVQQYIIQGWGIFSPSTDLYGLLVWLVVWRLQTFSGDGACREKIESFFPPSNACNP